MVVALLPAPAKTWGASLLGSYGRMNMPFDEAAARLRSERQPSLIIAQGMHLAGNMRLQFPDIPVVDAKDLAAGTDEAVKTNGPVLVVWVPVEAKPSEEPDVSALALQQGLAPSTTGILEFPYRFSRGGPLFRLAYAWLQ
jgi:hypothetical protein